MKKVYSYVAASAAIALFACSAFATPIPANLTCALVSEGDWIGVGIHDFSAFWNKPDDSLLKNLMSLSGRGRLPVVDKMVSSDLRISQLGGEVKNIAMAIEVKEDITFEDVVSAGPADAADFTVPEVEGATITPLATVKPRAEDKNSAGDINIAMLDRDGAKFLIASSGEPSNLAVMATAPEGDVPVATHVSGNMWVLAHSRKFTDPWGDANFDVELGFDDTRTSIKVYAWANVIDLVKSTMAGDGLEMSKAFTEEAPEAPHLYGTSPLYGVINLSASFLNPELNLADVLNAEEFAVVQEKLNDIRENLGLEWSDILAALRGNITFGISGTAVSPLLSGAYPGAFLNVSGISEQTAASIVELVKNINELGFINLVPYEIEGMKGIQSMVPASLVLAYGYDEGLTLALMLPDEMLETPEAAFSIAPAVEARNIAVAFDVRALRPVLKDIYARYGELILSCLGGDEKDKEKIETILSGLVTIDGLSIVNEGDVLVTEITPNEDIMSLALFINKIKNKK